MSFEERALLEFKMYGLSQEAQQLFLTGARAGHADAERELRAPGPCGVAGHTNADTRHYHYLGDLTTGFHADRECACSTKEGVDYYCAACRREQHFRDAIDGLNEQYDAALDIIIGLQNELKPLVGAEKFRVIAERVGAKHRERLLAKEVKA